MPLSRKVVLAAFWPAAWVILIMHPAQAQTCEDGQVLAPGDSCELSVRWGHDHWVTGIFPGGGGNYIEFNHLEGDCSVALFGGIDTVLGPDQSQVRSSTPGDYHLFTRAMSVARQDCRYQIAVK